LSGGEKAEGLSAREIDERITTAQKFAAKEANFGRRPDLNQEF